MGLDMSVYKYNKKMDEKTFNNVMIARNYNDDYETFIEEGKQVLKEINGDYNSIHFLEFCKQCLNKFTYESMTEEPMSQEEYDKTTNISSKHSCYDTYLKKHANEIQKARRRIYMDLCETLEEKEKQKQIFEKEKELLKELGDPEEICYWRKHSDLNGYMEQLYHEKGGQGVFNCEPLLLSKEDVRYIIIDHKKHLDDKHSFKIEEARGFFWGESEREDWEESLKDFEKIFKETDWDNSTVYYSCWW